MNAKIKEEVSDLEFFNKVLTSYLRLSPYVLALTLVFFIPVYFLASKVPQMFVFDYLMYAPKISSENSLMPELSLLKKDVSINPLAKEIMALIEFKHIDTQEFFSFDGEPRLIHARPTDSDNLFEVQLRSADRSAGTAFLDGLVKEIQAIYAPKIGSSLDNKEALLNEIDTELREINSEVEQVRNNIKKLGYNPILFQQLVSLKEIAKVLVEKRYLLLEATSANLFNNLEVWSKVVSEEAEWPNFYLILLVSFFALFSLFSFLSIFVVKF